MNELGKDLCTAAFMGSLSFLEDVLSVSDASTANLTDNVGDTPLHRAVVAGQLECAHILLENKADVNARGQNGADAKTGLTTSAIQDKIIEITTLLVARRGKLNAEDDNGMTPEDIARKFKFTDLAQIMAELKVEQELMEKELERRTQIKAFEDACSEGAVNKVAQILEQLPCIVDETFSSGDPPIVAAAHSGSAELVLFLLEHGATSLVNHETKETALHAAVRTGDKDLFVSLLHQCPQLLMSDFNEEETPLHIAAEIGHTHLVEIFLQLVEQGRETCSADTTGASELEKASAQLDPFCASKHGGSSPLHRAVENRHLEVVHLYCSFVKSLMEKFPEDPSPLKGLEKLDRRGFNAFHLAAALSDVPAMESLLEVGADINARVLPDIDRSQNPNQTALSMAGSRGDCEVVRFLLHHGAKDPENKAIRRTLRGGHTEAAGLMLCYNEYASIVPASKDPNVPLHEGKRPDYAVSLMWNNRDLTALHEKWLHMATVERSPLDSLAAVTQVDLSSNQLQELPLALFQLPFLIKVDVSKNNLEFLPTAGKLGWKCFHLVELRVKHNRLKSIPEGVFKLPRLRELEVSHNHIESIPVAMWLAPKLTVLRLSYNRLVKLQFPHPLDEDDFNLSFSTSVSAGTYMSPVRTESLSLLSPSTPRSQSNGQKSLMDLAKTLSATHMEPQMTFTHKRAEMVANRQNYNRRFRFLDSVDEGEGEELAAVAETNPSPDDAPSCLETLDLAHNQLTCVPHGLCCLAPRLHKLIIAHNQISDLGHVNDYPPDLDTLDAQSNQLRTAVKPVLGSNEATYMNMAGLPVGYCPRSYLQHNEDSPFSPPTPALPCRHRIHRALKKLSSYRLSNNKLQTVQLFIEMQRRSTGSFLKGTPPEGASGSDESSGTGSSQLTHTPTDDRPHTKSVFGKRNSNSSGHSSGGDEEVGSQDMSDFVPIPMFPELTTLEVASNKLKTVPKHIHHSLLLGSLDISHNTEITTLPLLMGHLEALYYFEYKQVPLKNPSVADLDKFKTASEKIFFMKTLLQEAVANDCMKLMLVGLQKQGKTTILAHLTEVNETDSLPTTFVARTAMEKTPTRKGKPGVVGSPLSTVGVDLGMWKYNLDREPSYRLPRGAPKNKSVTFYTWDFGGQEEYYATHQVFLSSRSLYLIVWNMTRGEEGIEQLAPWLHNIESRAPGSPVIIVGTHLDKFKTPAEKEELKSKYEGMIRQTYRERYKVGEFRKMDPGLPDIKGVKFVGLPERKDGRPEGLAELRQFIYETVWDLRASGRHVTAKHRRLLEQPIPQSFLKLQFRVREVAAKLRAERRPPVMRETVFREAMKDVIESKRELDQAVTYLHEIGVVLHYDTPALNHLYFVDPQWLCDMLAHVITVPEVNRWINRDSGLNSGILNKSALQQVFRGQIFPIEFQQEYIELLNKFEVAIQIDRSSLLVPSCLSTKPAYTLHRRVNFFPRLTLEQIAEFIPELFTSSEDHRAAVCDTDHQLFPQYTGLILRRFYFMPHVPSGFWPRLISRFLADTNVHTVVLECLGYTKSEIEEELRGRSGTNSVLSWVYWRTGLELWYQNSRSILRVTEVMGKKGAFRGCKPSQSPFDVHTQPVDPVKDACDLLFDLHGAWTPTDVNRCPRGIEIIVSDCISRQVIQGALAKEKNGHQTGQTLPPSTQEPPVCAATECRWMGAELLAYTADVLDLLLEDWFPGIGSRDTVKNRFDLPYVNRIVPCPFCVSQASTLELLDGQSQSSTANPEVVGDQGESERLPKSKWRKKKGKYKLNRPLFTPSPGRSPVKEKVGGEFFPLVPLDDASDVMVVSDCEEENPLLPTAAEEDAEESEDTVVEGTFHSINQFGFMVDSLILLSRTVDVVTCPLHKETPLPIRDLAPDLTFADFQKFHIAKPCLLLSNFVGGGAFGDIYQGTVLPHRGASEFDGIAVAIKISAEESPRKLKAKAAEPGSFRDNPDEVALKTHSEVRAEASLLKDLEHPNLIRFVGLSLKPLAIVLEWAPKKGMRKVLADYCKADARLSPATLQETARQISAGLEYLHSRGTAHFDLKSDNVLVFNFPTPQFALESTTPGAIKLTRQQSVNPHKTALQLKEDDPTAVRVKITDFGISRQSSLGQYRHRGGTPGFMAPEILRYSGKEAVQSKVDVFSFAMVMYEMMSLQCPFEAEGLHPQQIDKLTVDGKRPILSSRELNNPALFLELMQWCWLADYNKRPSATLLKEVLSSPSIPHLIDTVSLGALESVTCACSCPLLIPTQDGGVLSDWEVTQTFQSSTSTLTSHHDGDKQHQQFLEASGAKNVLTPPPMKHVHAAIGDMFQEVWVASYNPIKFPSAQLHIIGFQGKTKHYVHSLHAPRAPVTAMCAVNSQRDPHMTTMWVATEHGELYILHAGSRKLLLDRQLAIYRDTQGIVSILHMPLSDDHSVVVIRKDGCLLLFDDEISQHKFSDDPKFDNCRFDTPLPVKSVVKTRNDRLVYSALVRDASNVTSEIWCGCDKGEVQLFQFSYGKLEYATNVSYSSFPGPAKWTRKEECYVAQLVLGKNSATKRDQVWGLVQPEGVIMCWDAQSKQAVKQLRCSNFTGYQVSSIQIVNSTCIYLATRAGKVVSVEISEQPPSSKELHGHCGDVYSILPLGSRVLPRQWLPSIIGRINVMDKFSGELPEETIKLIQDRIVGRSLDILVTVGKGFYGLGKSNPLASSSDSNDSFLLLWM